MLRTSAPLIGALDLTKKLPRYSPLQEYVARSSVANCGQAVCREPKNKARKLQIP